MYVISGLIYHKILDLRKRPLNPQHFYFLNSADANLRRIKNKQVKECHPELLSIIDRVLREINPFAQLYPQLREVVQNENATEGEEITKYGIQLFNSATKKRDNNNANEIGAVFSSRHGDIPPPGYIRVYLKQVGETIRIHELSRTSDIADPLCYPLLFPYGTFGWNINMPLDTNRSRSFSRKRVSMKEYYQYKIQIRGNSLEDDRDVLIKAGKLTQQYIVDAYVKVEGDRLNYLRQNQKLLLAENYVGLIDYVKRLTENTTERVGKVVILPSTFTGSARFMESNYQDCMAIVCKYGRPSLFITMTCNPNWSEIKKQLLPNQVPQDRPDITARVFYIKFKNLMKRLNKDKIFGEVVAYSAVIEFQKRGLPHAHILVTLADQDKLREAEQIDEFISAELPDETEYPRLFQLVSTLMIHGPCGNKNPNSPCMVDGKCTKYYPKQFVEKTHFMNNKIIHKRRRGPMRLINANNTIKTIDNRDVVTYCPFLTLENESHINVVVVSDVGACKYLYKYINKSPETALYTINNETVYDQIRSYQETRYVSSGMAAWKLFGFPIHLNSHTVVRLPVHLPGEKIVYYEEGAELDACESKAFDIRRFF